MSERPQLQLIVNDDPEPWPRPARATTWSSNDGSPLADVREFLASIRAREHAREAGIPYLPDRPRPWPTS